VQQKQVVDNSATRSFMQHRAAREAVDSKATCCFSQVREALPKK
jgi:hypothetical protein